MVPDRFPPAHGDQQTFPTAPPIDRDAWMEKLQQERVFFSVDLANRITFVTASVQPILGYEPASLIGRDYRDVFDLDHPLRDKLLEATRHFSPGDPPDLRRTAARRADGQLTFLVLREQEIATERGLVSREFMAEDIAVRVDAVFRLRQSERKYRRLVEGVSGEYVIYSRDVKGVFTYVSPSVKGLLGYESQELVGVNAREIHADPAIGREVIERFNRIAESGQSVVSEVIELVRRDGGRRLWEIDERPVFAFDSQLASFEGIGKDVTEAAAADRLIRESKEELERRVAFRTEELLRMYEDLRASEARYRDVVETLHDFIVRWKPGGVRTFANEAYCQFHGVSKSDLVGANLFLGIHPDDVDEYRQSVASLTAANQFVSNELRVRKQDGQYFPIQWRTRGKFDAEGNPVEYQAIGRDVTELRAAADLLREKEVHLAHLARLATMGEMVAGIAHEISQPLHAAKTFAEAARRNLQSGGSEKIAKAIECTSEISEAVTRTVQIIRRLREFTKSQPFELEALSINDIVREAADLAGYAIRRASAKLRLQLADGLPEILGDRIQLEQLVVNLLTNGCEAMEKTPVGERTLTVRTALVEQTLTLSIVDAGVGVDEAEMHRLFEAFYTTKPEGMGMGLVLSQSIAEAHGGELRAERNPAGRGMTFVLSLPISGGHS